VSLDIKRADIVKYFTKDAGQYKMSEPGNKASNSIRALLAGMAQSVYTTSYVLGGPGIVPRSR